MVQTITRLEGVEGSQWLRAKHAKYGSYANSDLFPSLLKRACDGLGLNGYVRLDRVPSGVTIDATGFLHVVSIDL